MKNQEHFFNVNKATWNEKVKVHAESNMYDLNAFIEGKSSLMSYELEALGDVKGKSLLHLQCHFGQDTLSWSRMGAQCVGIDISEEGIQLAQKLNEELGLDAKFICCNVFDTSKHVKETFDIVFTSYGVIGWLPDLKPWGQLIAEKLKPGGTFFIAEFHPIVWMFDHENDYRNMKYGYMQKEPIYVEYEGTYANNDSKIISKEYGWNHGLGAVVNALTEAGLHIEYLNEFDESPYDIFQDLTEAESRMFVTKDRLYPLIFTLKAKKK